MKNEEINSEIREHWLSFSMLPGSHAIASHSALNAIFALSVIRPPKIVLEIDVFSKSIQGNPCKTVLDKVIKNFV